jgi:hypothetical protein
MGASKPTRASYLNHVPKARIEEMISEAVAQESCSGAALRG